MTAAPIPEPAPDPRIGPWLQMAIDAGQAELYEEAGKTRIRYVAMDHTEIFDDPEEWVRADYWAELIHQYGYSPKRIAIEVPVPDRTPGDFADLAICRDDALTEPFAVVECKPENCTDAEFEQAVEQAVGNGTWAKLRADFVVVAAGDRRRVLDFVNYGIGSRTKTSSLISQRTTASRLSRSASTKTTQTART